LETLPETALLRVTNLKKHFSVRRGLLQRVTHQVKAVDGVDFKIAQGRTLGLVGESGCGKSTVARLVLKLLQPDGGRIAFRGRDISQFTERQMKPLRKEMQIVFQDPFGSLNPRMSVGQSIGEGLRQLGLKSRAAQRRELRRLLEMVGLSADSEDRYPHEFSGGQRQRIGIARALSVNPSLIVCDEPISALDVSIQAQIINLLKDLQDELGVSYLFISHDLNVVGYLCHTVSVMYRGKIMEHATVEEIFDDPRHPYTLTLLEAIPDPNYRAGRRLQLPPDTAEREVTTGGCPFQGRCSQAAPECRRPDIPFIRVSDTHSVRCRSVQP
jgi:oligopeptide/dipeptide ABC transporter ATP-binding protein